MCVYRAISAYFNVLWWFFDPHHLHFLNILYNHGYLFLEVNFKPENRSLLSHTSTPQEMLQVEIITRRYTLVFALNNKQSIREPTRITVCPRSPSDQYFNFFFSGKQIAVSASRWGQERSWETFVFANYSSGFKLINLFLLPLVLVQSPSSSLSYFTRCLL